MAWFHSNGISMLPPLLTFANIGEATNEELANRSTPQGSFPLNGDMSV